MTSQPRTNIGKGWEAWFGYRLPQYFGWVAKSIEYTWS